MGFRANHSCREHRGACYYCAARDEWADDWRRARKGRNGLLNRDAAMYALHTRRGRSPDFYAPHWAAKFSSVLSDLDDDIVDQIMGCRRRRYPAAGRLP